jgi:hypothetical protein
MIGNLGCRAAALTAQQIAAPPIMTNDILTA